MPNTSLPTSGINDGSDNHINHHYTVHAEVNRMSRDTGEVDVTSLLTNGWTANYVGIRRQDNLVTFTVDGLNGSAASSTIFLPVGSSGVSVGVTPPTLPAQSPAYLAGGGDELCRLYIQSNAFRVMYAGAGQATMTAGRTQWVYTTTRSFPSSVTS